MAFVGPVAGALVAGGLHDRCTMVSPISSKPERTTCAGSTHTFSSLLPMPSLTRNLYSVFLLPSSPLLAKNLNAPPSAASRITSHPWSSYAESRWNQEIAYLFAGVREWDRRASEWGRKVLYGEQTPNDKKS
ncbi:hypothetical protein D9756_008656 [Leucocoprinus leucothites]|uniref:Uncharacterized protein n=1 Tax=Leucocoprinus leucothites TaxID=201217 RepID=A0A8H5D0P5_9AGAR|nr:hypothetical protein D9756_008656 [Leucoagaricus leucothites]